MYDSIRQHKASGLRYYDAGTGAVLLFLHGFGSSPVGYAPLLEALSKTYRVIAPFLYSPGVKGIEDSVHRIELLMKDLGIAGPYIVASYSIGSYTAAIYTSRNTSAVSRVILISALVDPGGLFFIDRGARLFLSLCRHLFVHGQQRHILRLFAIFLGNIIRNPLAIILQLQEAYRMEVVPVLQNTGRVAHIISGTRDTVVPPQQEYKLHEALPSSILTMLPGDHLMGIVAPEMIVREV